MGDKFKYIRGVRNIAHHINEKVFPKVTKRYPYAPPATEKTIRRHLKDGTLVHESRSSDKDPYAIEVNSLTPEALGIDPDCEWLGYEDLATGTGWKLRSVKAFVKSSKWAADLFGRYYFNPSSYTNLKKIEESRLNNLKGKYTHPSSGTPCRPQKRGEGNKVPPKYEINAKNRIRTFLKKFADVVRKAEDVGFNESDTRTLVLEVLTSALGYDKFFEITGEFEIKGRYADFAIKLDNKVRFFIEVKAIGSKLSEKDLFQVQSYSASHNLAWMVLTSGRMWKCYHLSQGNPPEIEEVFEMDLIAGNLIDTAEKMYLLSKEAVWRDALSDYWEIARASSPASITQCLLDDKVLDEIRREVYRTMKQKLDNDLIYEILTTQIIKGNVLSQVKLSPKTSKRPVYKKDSAPTKKGLPAICFAYLPDETKPSTWRLRYRNPDGSVSSTHLAGAVAALSPGGFRGKRVEIPPADLPEVKSRLLEAYRELGTPEEQIPPGIRENLI